jgi:hypothetical protein
MTRLKPQVVSSSKGLVTCLTILRILPQVNLLGLRNSNPLLILTFFIGLFILVNTPGEHLAKLECSEILFWTKIWLSSLTGASLTSGVSIWGY